MNAACSFRRLPGHVDQLHLGLGPNVIYEEATAQIRVGERLPMNSKSNPPSIGLRLTAVFSIACGLMVANL